MNNKKNFKSEYSKYIQNIKPSDDLIKKTLELANKEQEKIQKSKEKSSMRFLYNINFKKLSALACTLVFAIFAVKLWNDIDKQPVPVKHNIITDTTTDTSTTQSYVTTAPVEFSSDEPTSSIDVSTIDTLTDSTSYNSTCSSSCITDSSTVYNNENIYTTTTNDSTSTDVPNSINDNTSSTTMTTNKNSSAVNSNSHKFTPTTTTTTTTTTSKHTNTIVTSTTKTTTTTSFEYIDTTLSIEPTMSYTTKPSSPDNSGDGSNNNANSGGESPVTTEVVSSEVINPATTNPSINITFISTTTHVECTTMAETTSAQDNSINSPTGNAETKRCMAIRVSLLNVENGFFEDSTIYKDRIMDYLPYGKELMGIIPLGKTSNSDCDCILIFNAQSLAVSYGIHSTEVIKDLNNYEYSKIEIVDNPTNDNASQYLEFQMLKLNLDFNNNGLGAEVDIDDRNTLLSMLTIDDAPLE